MKVLFLVRHAKSSWDDTSLPDIRRPLGKRGKRDAPQMGDRLSERGASPDLIVASPATRAITTATVIATKLGYEVMDIVVDNRLYPGDKAAVLNVIRGFDDGLNRVMLFGHNPGLTELAHSLSKKITHMATCAVVELVFDVKSWSKADKSKLVSAALDFPKKFHDETPG